VRAIYSIFFSVHTFVFTDFYLLRIGMVSCIDVIIHDLLSVSVAQFFIFPCFIVVFVAVLNSMSPSIAHYDFALCSLVRL
jgi:hypothetical protein